jgi:hypothetical protein
MEPTQTPADETWLAEQLAAKLKALETVTTTAAVASFDVLVSVTDKNARATGTGLREIEVGLEHILKEELPLIVESVIGQKRIDVEKARNALLDYQFKALKPKTDTPLATHDAEPTGPAPGEPGSPFPPPPPEVEAGGVAGSNGAGDELYPRPNYDAVTTDLAAAEADTGAHWIKF